MKIYKTGIAHHLKALCAGVQVGNQFSSRIGYKYLKEGSKMNVMIKWSAGYSVHIQMKVIGVAIYMFFSARCVHGWMMK